MSDTARIDELNIIRSVPYEEFFGEMKISDEKKRELIRIAEDFEEDYLTFIILISDYIDAKKTDYDTLMWEFAFIWESTASKYLFDREFISEYAPAFAKDAIDSTLRNVGDEWFFSDDRAVFNAENEALTIFNRGEYLDAVEKGLTRKRWVSLLDGRERKTHRIADGQEVGIFEFFQVGKAKMQYPKAPCNHPKEVINCRCYVAYH